MTELRCLVTGCASGIGRHLVGALLARGHRVAATDRLPAEDRLSRVATEDAWGRERTLLVTLDVTRADQWAGAMDAAVEAWGGIDVVYNVAGYLCPGDILSPTDDEVDRHVDVNLRGVVLGTRAAARHMIPAGSGHVVNVASIAALSPVPGLALYSATKYAVRAWSVSAAQELKRHGVHVTVFCPDAVDTPMLEAQVGHEASVLPFSGFRVLSVEEVSQALTGPVLRRRPMVYVLPRYRGWIARVGDLLPGPGFRLLPFFERIGRAGQARYRAGK